MKFQYEHQRLTDDSLHRFHIHILPFSSCALGYMHLHVLQELVQDETRGKLAAQAKARQEHDEKEALQDRLEEEEEAKKHLEKQNADLQAKVLRFIQ